MTDQRFVCPSCGERTGTLHEGYCPPCLEQRNDAHLRNLAEIDRWNRMSPAERDREIRQAVRRA